MGKGKLGVMDTPLTPAHGRQKDYSPSIILCYKARLRLTIVNGAAISTGVEFFYKFGPHLDHMITISILGGFILFIMAAAVYIYTTRVSPGLVILCLFVNSYYC